MKTFLTKFMTISKKLFAILAVGLLIGPMLVNAQTVSVAYDFTVSNFGDGVLNSEPAPVESFSGSFGFTFEPSDVNTQYEIAADFVDLSILGVEYTVENTAIEINDGDVIAIVFGGLAAGPSSAFPFTNDFWLVFFIDDLGELFAPGVIGSSLVRIDTSSDFWLAPAADVVVTRRSLDPGTLLEQLGTAVTEVGPGNSLADKIMLAQTYLEVPDEESACLILGDFLNQVQAQRGKKLTEEQADQYTADAVVIMDAVGCD